MPADFPDSGREARLKPQFAHLYPSIVADQWSAAMLVRDRAVSWLLRNGRTGYVASDRILPAEHFDFRGDCPRPGALPEGRSRHGDAERLTWPMPPLNPADPRDYRVAAINVIRGIALAYGAARTDVLETIDGDRLVLRMHMESDSTVVEFTGPEIDQVLVDVSVNDQLHARIREALLQLGDPP